MNITKRILCMIALFFGAGSAFAECTATACVDVRITQLYVTASGNVHVKTSGNPALLNCSPASGVFITLDMSLPNSKELYALLLSAHLQGKPVAIRIEDNSQGCIIAYMTSDN